MKCLNEDIGISELQNNVDFLIKYLGDTLGEITETVSKLGFDGEIKANEQENIESNLLSIVIVLKELNSLRIKLVKHKYRDCTFNHLMAPIDLKRIEALKKKSKF